MPSFTQATRSDRDTLLAFMRDFYAGESLQFTAQVVAALDALVDNDGLGIVCLILSDTQTAGYFVLTYGYSLERGGLTALLDELYILPAARNQGLGKAALAHAAEIARTAGCTTLHLEVDRENLPVQELYRRAGFTQLPRHYLALPLTSPTAAPHQK
jgi:ribosomal protein S18 acetylase RimI-like enzyme